MNFAAPLAFAATALALPIIVLYILKVKRRRVSVPYLRLWEELLVETRARSLFQRLKRFYSLLLQLLILAALAFALTQPAFELASVKKESVVLLLDTSASMNALEGEERQVSRFLGGIESRDLEPLRQLVPDGRYVDHFVEPAAFALLDINDTHGFTDLIAGRAAEDARTLAVQGDIYRRGARLLFDAGGCVDDVFARQHHAFVEQNWVAVAFV